jgi:tagatose-6-phosphate ketose/aldose isomerase
MREPAATLGLTAAQIQAGGALFTAREIAQQPDLWPEAARLVERDTALTAFLAPLLGERTLRVVLTGAGTSGFVGECLAPALARAGTHRIEAIASTDIVASPQTWFAARMPTLVVSFARSGDSPESMAVVDLATRCVERCAHLIITCNALGELYRRASSMRNTHALLLPEAMNDQSFAMTSSFTGMLLSAALALRAIPPDQARLARVSALAAQVLNVWQPQLQDLVSSQFERIVYLGSNELKGIAREAALKMLELTDGRVVAMADAPIGFRHGPKTILNSRTLVVMFLSGDEYTRRYELDLLRELGREGVAPRVVALSDREDLPAHRDTLVLSDTAPGASSGLSDLELCLPYVVFAQSLGMLRSLSLGLSPDKPNIAGTVSRVVQGVTVYPYERSR